MTGGADRRTESALNGRPLNGSRMGEQMNLTRAAIAVAIVLFAAACGTNVNSETAEVSSLPHDAVQDAGAPGDPIVTVFSSPT